LAFLPFLSQTQYCETGGPSSTADSNLEALSITGVSGSINYTGCPGTPGLEYYTAETVTLSAGGSYVLNIQFGTCGGNFSSVGEVWIDFNGNSIFEPSESLLTWSGQPMTSPTGYVISVPANALSGTHRMRVMQAEQSTLPLDPCANFTWGSVTDFNVTLTGGIDCSGYVGDDRFDPRIVSSIPFTESHNSSICYTNQNPTYNAPDVFYKIVPNGIPALKVSLCGSSFDTFLSIVDQNGMAIYGNDDSGACGTSSEVEFLTEGHDTLFAVVEGWGIASGDYTITITEVPLAVLENNTDKLILYPNPANDRVSFDKHYSGTVKFFSTQGRIVHETILNNDLQMDVSHLPRGMYIIELTTNNATLQQKIILK
jgi:hypothetical protein